MLRSSLRRARLGPVFTFAGALILLAACSGAGSAVSTAAPTASLAPAAPSSAASSSSAPSAAPTEATSGGGKGGVDYDDGGAASASPVVGPQAQQVNVATGPLGTYLTGDSGLTLYTFKPDSANTSTCVNSCAKAWPPLTSDADDTLVAGDGVTGALTTFARADGSVQVAYDGAPLYYFANDTEAGDTKGQGIGDAWFAAKP